MGLFNKKIKKETRTILDFVYKNIDEDGKYNGNDLPDRKPIAEKPLVWWPLGGKEGIIFLNGIEQSLEIADIMFNSLINALKDKSKRSELYLRAKENDCMFYSDELIEKLSTYEKLNYNELFHLAFWLIFEGEDTEAVKLGLTLMMFFKIFEIKDNNNVPISEFMMILGKCPEFTYYVINLLKANDVSNDTLFSFAKTTTGWGGVFAIAMLEAENEEIIQWLLLNAMKELDYAERVAPMIFEKCNVCQLLKQTRISYEQYEAITLVLDCISEDENLITADNWNETAKNFFYHSVTHCHDIAALKIVLEIKDIVLNDESVSEQMLDEIIDILDQIEQKTNWNDQIFKHLCSENYRFSWCAIWLSTRRNLEVFDILFNELQNYPNKLRQFDILLREKDPKKFGKVLEFIEEHIESYLEEEYTALSIIQELSRHPHKGEYIISKALCSKGEFHISSCINVIESWGVDYISKPIRDSLKIALEIEENRRNLQRIKKLLAHEIDDGSDFTIRL